MSWFTIFYGTGTIVTFPLMYFVGGMAQAHYYTTWDKNCKQLFGFSTMIVPVSGFLTILTGMHIWSTLNWLLIVGIWVIDITGVTRRR